MPKNQLTKISRFLSLILRHQPQAIDLTLDSKGWANIDELITKARQSNKAQITVEILQEIVDTNDKKRFSISDDGKKIRANQGHSIDIDLGLEPTEPPAVLYHGTASRFMKTIMQQGLIKRSRQHVHLSKDIETAKKVGARHGLPAILVIDTYAMTQQGHQFFVSENGVWLTDEVPVKFIKQK